MPHEEETMTDNKEQIKEIKQTILVWLPTASVDNFLRKSDLGGDQYTMELSDRMTLRVTSRNIFMDYDMGDQKALHRTFRYYDPEFFQEVQREFQSVSGSVVMQELKRIRQRIHEDAIDKGLGKLWDGLK